ncbi:MAG: site-specific integrase [Gammaproteobacteria bacterium]|nr:site-specific integrase [Gammaproteobacteria bacterium]
MALLLTPCKGHLILHSFLCGCDQWLRRQEQFIHQLGEHGCSKGYIGRILGVGKAALNRAYKRGEIATVPYVLTGSKGRERERILSLDEAAALFNAVDAEHMLMYLLLAFNTLARPEAILELRRFQLDLDNRLIRLNPPAREQTKKRRPTLPITNTLFPWLQNTKSDVLVNWRGRHLNSIKKGFRRLRERAGLDADVIPYTVRHTMATELRKRAVPAWEVSGFLGHKSHGSTDRYAKYAPDYLGQAVQAIDQYFFELQPLVKQTLVFGEGVRVSCVLEARK